jgi:hypothetical protein
LKVVFNGTIRALAKSGVLGAKVTGIADGTDLDWITVGRRVHTVRHGQGKRRGPNG